MPTPEEIAAQEAAAKAAADEAAAKKAAEDAAAKPTEDAKSTEDAKAAEEAARAEEARKAAEEAEKQPPPDPTASEGAEKRIRELVAKQRDAERLAEYYRGLAEGRIKPADKTPAGAPPLKIEDFLPTEQEFAAVGLTADVFDKAGRTYDELLMAKSAYAMEKRRVVEARRMAEEQAKASIAKSQAVFMDRLNKAAETDPDLPLIVNASSPTDPYFVPISDAMAEVIRESEVGPKMLRHFANNKGEAQRIYGLPPIAAARELGRIEAKILAAPAPEPPKRVSQAPEPIKPLTPTGPTEIDLDKIPIDDFMKKRNAQQYGAGKA